MYRRSFRFTFFVLALTVFIAQSGLASATLLSIREIDERLVDVDPMTGLATPIAPANSVGVDQVALTYQPTTNVLYGLGMGRVLTIDPSTGIGTETAMLPASVGGSMTSAFHFDTTTSTFFGVDGFADDRLVSIDVSSGAASVIGEIGFESVDAIIRHTGNGTVYAVSNLSSQLLAIDPTTGAGTAVASLPFSNITGLAYVPATDQLLALSFGQLVEIDVLTGDLTPIGPGGPVAPDIRTLVLIPEPTTATLIGLGLAALARRRSPPG